MDDLLLLDEAWPTPAAPSPQASARARALLLDRARRGRSAIRLRLRVLAATAAALLVGVTVAENLGGTGAKVAVATAAPVLERAAAAAETRPFVPPRDDQWVYIEERVVGAEDGVTRRTWRRADGKGLALLDDSGKLHVETTAEPRPRRPGPSFFETYRAVAALPTEPEALLRWAYQRAGNAVGGGGDHGEAYLILNHTLRGTIVPPALEAGIFRAMKRIPGVTVETAEISGRPVLALGLPTSDWLYEELLLDPETYAYAGGRSTVTRDAVLDPMKAGNATGEVTKGSQMIIERVRTAIVDEAGERPATGS